MEIKWIVEPTVHEIARSVLDDHGLINFFSSQGIKTDGLAGLHAADLENDDLDLIPEMAGRMCYMSFEAGRPTKEYIANIIEQGHESVLEHASITFFISGISRTLTHELVRHRVGVAYSQLSQRYVAYDKQIGFVIPPEYLGTEMESRFKEYITREYETYLMLNSRTKQADIPGSSVERKKRIQQASRAALPNCTETKIAITFNLRALRHFLLLRGSSHADPEIRRLALHLYYQVEDLAAFQDMEVVSFGEKDGPIPFCIQLKGAKNDSRA